MTDREQKEMNYILKKKERLLYASALSLYFIYFGPKIGFYSNADPQRIVFYGAPFPFASYSGSSLEWEYDIAALTLNFSLITSVIFFVFNFLNLENYSKILFRFFGSMICFPLIYLGVWFWLSGFYELVHINFMEYLSTVTFGEMDSLRKIEGKCLTFKFYSYLHGDQSIVCKN